MTTDAIKPSLWSYSIPILVFIVTMIFFVTNLFSGIMSIDKGFHRFVVPGKQTVHLSKSDHYDIYYEYESVLNGQIYSTGTKLKGMSCTLQNPATSEKISLLNPGMNSTYNISNKAGRSIFQFNIQKEGDYDFTCGYMDTNLNDEVVFAIGPDISPVIFKLVFGSIGTMFGGMALTGGTAVWIYVKRKSARAKLALDSLATATP